jgi:hypothetical protein
MITITLCLSESLLSIFRDMGRPLEETIVIQAASGITALEVMAGQGINPLLVPMMAVKTQDGTCRIDRDTAFKTDVELIFYGPLAGG